MKLCKPWYSKHEWKPWGTPIGRQLVYGFYYWFECEKCKKRQFAPYGWEEAKRAIAAQEKAKIKSLVDKVMGKKK